MSDFNEISVGQYLKLTSGFPFASSHFSHEGVPLIRIRDILSSNPETFFKGYYPPGYMITKGDVLIGMDGDFNVVRWRGCDALLNQRVLKVEVPNESVVIFDYVFHWLGPYINQVNTVTPATTVKHLSTKDLFRAKAKFPSTKAQRRIAAILDKVDITIEKTQTLIDKYQQIKTGLMQDLFTRGLLPNRQLRPTRDQAPELYDETNFGWIPKAWNIQKLGIVLSDSGGYLQTGPFGSQLHAHEYTSEGMPVIMPQDINDGLIDTTKIARIPDKRAQTLARHRLTMGDIIIARRGDLSRAAAVKNAETNWICGTGCFLLRLGKTELNPFFLSHLYRYAFIQRQIAGMQVGSTMPSLNNSVMSRLLFPLPPREEQDEITRRLDDIEALITAERAFQNKLSKQKLGLMQDLLTGTVQVNVDNQIAEPING